MYEGVCMDGPLRGRWMMVRYPGFLLADKPNQRCWLYKHREPGEFTLCPDGQGRLERPLDAQRALSAAVGGEYDVVALPGEAPDGGR